MGLNTKKAEAFLRAIAAGHWTLSQETRTIHIQYGNVSIVTRRIKAHVVLECPGVKRIVGDNCEKKWGMIKSLDAEEGELEKVGQMLLTLFNKINY